MRKFNIKVNGTSYEVDVEEIGTAPLKSPEKPAPVAVKPVATQSKAVSVASSASTGTGVNAPMPGTILEIKVTEGESVQKGQVLLILEAMKMENEITAPAAGIVGTIAVSKGASVVTNDVLVTFA